VVAKSLLPLILIAAAAGAIYYLLMQVRFSWIDNLRLWFNIFHLLADGFD
jgi:hypothetical protein